jgi:hypothetical protein
MVATNGNLIFMKVLFPIALTLLAASLTTSGKLNSISSTLSTVDTMHYLSADQLLAVGASNLWADAYVFTGKLYDQAFVQSCKNGSSAGAFTHGEFNGKEIACWIIPRYMKNGKWSNSTMWKVNGKRVAQKKLIEAVCKEV